MKRMSKLLEGNELFRKSYFKKNVGRLVALANNGQRPKVLFIGCADSRVIPSLITNSEPGSLFVVRNLGNFVPPYKPDEDYHATATTIEFAVNALGVSDIIVCGHTHCGAIAALYNTDHLDEDMFIHTRKWLSLGEKAKQMAIKAMGDAMDTRELLSLTEHLSVVTQIEHLLTYPYVWEKVEKGSLHLHGWMYDIETGGIDYYDPDRQHFQSLEDMRDEETQA